MTVDRTAADGSNIELGLACSRWQSGRDGGSSRLRGAARALTGIPHYFDADFITAHERAARADPATLRQAASLLRAVAGAELRDADGWCAQGDLEAQGFAGRGLQKNPKGEPQILAAIDSGAFTMPLWGLSLDPSVADSYGKRFRFVLEGAFPGVAAWLHSNEKHHEQEIIAGGSYRVLSADQAGDTTVVRLAYVSPVGVDVGTDPALLAVLARLESAGSGAPWREVTRSQVRRTPDGESLTATIDGAQVIELSRNGADARLTLAAGRAEPVLLQTSSDPDEILARLVDLLA